MCRDAGEAVTYVPKRTHKMHSYSILIKITKCLVKSNSKPPVCDRRVSNNYCVQIIFWVGIKVMSPWNLHKLNCLYYMANPVFGKSLCSDWFFLGQDFAVRTVETVQSVYFCFEANPANSKFETKTKRKKVWILSFFTLKLLEEAKKIEIFPKFQRWMEKTNIF